MKFKTNFKQSNKDFDSSMLEIGEMMELSDVYPGEIIIRAYSTLVSLTNPRHDWSTYANLKGRKLLPGESVTLTQE